MGDILPLRLYRLTLIRRLKDTDTGNLLFAVHQVQYRITVLRITEYDMFNKALC